MVCALNIWVRVINLEYGFLESRKRVSRINLESRWGGVCVCVCVCVSVFEGGVGMLRSRFRDPRIRDQHLDPTFVSELEAHFLKFCSDLSYFPGFLHTFSHFLLRSQ